MEEIAFIVFLLLHDYTLPRGGRVEDGKLTSTMVSKFLWFERWEGKKVGELIS